MKTYSDLQDIDHRLHCRLELEPVGTPEVSVFIDSFVANSTFSKAVEFDAYIDLCKPFRICIELKNKQYRLDTETAIKIKSLQIDGIDLVPRFDYLATYINDHNNDHPTNYLGFNGQWTLTIDRPFYQWLHQSLSQGWLID
jgi:hypothetical protein